MAYSWLISRAVWHGAAPSAPVRAIHRRQIARIALTVVVPPPPPLPLPGADVPPPSPQAQTPTRLSAPNHRRAPATPSAALTTVTTGAKVVHAPPPLPTLPLFTFCILSLRPHSARRDPPPSPTISHHLHPRRAQPERAGATGPRAEPRRRRARRRRARRRARSRSRPCKRLAVAPARQGRLPGVSRPPPRAHVRQGHLFRSQGRGAQRAPEREQPAQGAGAHLGASLGAYLGREIASRRIFAQTPAQLVMAPVPQYRGSLRDERAIREHQVSATPRDGTID